MKLHHFYFRNILNFCFFLLIFSLTLNAQPIEKLYVSPNGSDSNPGTMNEPFKTLEKAQETVREINNNMSKDIVVYLRGGRFQLEETIVFETKDSGTNGYTITYSAYQDEQPIISGGRIIKDWTLWKDGIYKADSEGMEFRQLYVNGKRTVRSRTPEVGQYYRLYYWDEHNRTIKIPAAHIEKWQQFKKIEMIGQLHWAESFMRLASFSLDGDTALVTVQEPERNLVFTRENPPKNDNESFHFENSIEFLNSPGEWYLDTATESVYYMPRQGENMNEVEVIAPHVQTIMKFNGTLGNPVHHIRFEGLSFQHSNFLLPSKQGYLNTQGGFYTIRHLGNNLQYCGRQPAAIYATCIEQIEFEENIFTNLGAGAIDFHYGALKNTINGNVFYDIAGNGILLAKFTEPDEEIHEIYLPADSREICRANTITNNYITRIGQDYVGSIGINCGFPEHTVIDHNEIHNLPYIGISLGWGWLHEETTLKNNRIRFNDLYDCVNLLCDAGAIYTLCPQNGTHIYRNYIHHIKRSEWAVGAPVEGIFFDEGSGGILLEENIMRCEPSPDIRFHNTEEIVCRRNNHYWTELRGIVVSNAGLQEKYKHIKEKVK